MRRSEYDIEPEDTRVRKPLAFEDSPPMQDNPHHVAARGFGQMFGLCPAMAFLTLIVDTMLFGGAVVSLGTSLPVSLVAGLVIGYITYNAQIKWAGDDKECARIKAIIVAFLTAIPSPLPYLLFVPAGIVGFFHGRRS